jgi:hypothetical protein
LASRGLEESDTVEIWLPYGSSEIPARIPEERLVEIIKPSKMGQSRNLQEEVKGLVESSSELREKAAGAKQICIALGASANSQALWGTAMILAQALIDTGVSPSSLKVLCTPDAGKLDPANFPDIAVGYHDPASSSTDPLNHFEGDFSPAVSSAFMKSDLRLVVGELKPHHFFGYTGFCDVVFPGLGSEASAQAQSLNRKGLEVSDILKERLRIANTLENLYALGFVLDSELVPAEISFGSIESCMKELKAKVDNICSWEVKKTADIAIISAGGAPGDESLVRAVETFPSGLEILKREGIMIVAAECAKGHGNGDFYRWCVEQKEPRHLEARLRHSFNYDGYKAAFLLRALVNHRIYLVSTVPDHYVENVFGMRSAQTVNAALQTAQRAIGPDSTITVVPDGSRVSPKHVHTET